jgi:hypothetical protein
MPRGSARNKGQDRQVAANIGHDDGTVATQSPRSPGFHGSK